MAFAFEDRAWEWFQWMDNRHRLTTWSEFKKLVEKGFRSNAYDDIQGQSSKLTQIDIIEECFLNLKYYQIR